MVHDTPDAKTATRGLPSPAFLLAIGLVATIVAFLIVVVSLLLTGGRSAVSENAAVIGALVALGGVFTTQLVNMGLEDQRARETRSLEGVRAQRTLELEKDRAEDALKLEKQRWREAALQKYLEQVGKLLIEHSLYYDSNPNEETNHPSLVIWPKKLLLWTKKELQALWLRNSNLYDVTNGAREVARAQTLATLEVLDEDRKRILVQFLYELELIKGRAPISLRKANLSEAALRKADLEKANMSEANLEGATLQSANLSGADLVSSKLAGAKMSGANLPGADLSGADLVGSELNTAVLTDANLSGALASEANFYRANLSGAVLKDSILRDTTLMYADLSNADLSGATITRADLSNADLSGAIVTDAQLAECSSLKNTIRSGGTK